MKPSVVSTTWKQALTATTITADLPATVHDGDLLLVFAFAGTSTNWTHSTPSGWTAISAETSRIIGYAKKGLSSDSGGTVGAFTNSAAADMGTYVVRIKHADTTIAIANAVKQASSGISQSSTLTTPSVSPTWTDSNTLGISLVHIDYNQASSITLPAGLTYTTNNTTASSDGIHDSIAYAYPGTGAWNPNDGSLGWTPFNCCYTLLVKPAPGGALFWAFP